MTSSSALIDFRTGFVSNTCQIRYTCSSQWQQRLEVQRRSTWHGLSPGRSRALELVYIYKGSNLLCRLSERTIAILMYHCLLCLDIKVDFLLEILHSVNFVVLKRVMFMPFLLDTDASLMAGRAEVQSAADNGYQRVEIGINQSDGWLNEN